MPGMALARVEIGFAALDPLPTPEAPVQVSIGSERRPGHPGTWQGVQRPGTLPSLVAAGCGLGRALSQLTAPPLHSEAI